MKYGETASVGLCLTCCWMHSVTNRRGSTFYRCGRADTDPDFPRYPALPVLRCRGYEPKEAGDEHGRGEKGEASS